MGDVHCPDCDKLVAVMTSDFTGSLAWFCRRCKAHWGLDGEWPRLSCVCGRWLLSGLIETGGVRMTCSRCRVLVEVRRSTRRRLEPLTIRPHRRRRGLEDGELVALIEDRWSASQVGHARRRAEVAVGLRFDVFNRDGFRCVYCGRGPAQGVLLEADHVIARARGGPDTLANLVTACGDCNRGKSAKVLAAV